jgi:hypothetical protein
MVKIVEFVQPKDSVDAPYDKLDDLHQYMINDRDFYRKRYYPTMCGLKKISSKDLLPMIDEACGNYVEKFNIVDPVEKFFSNNERKELAAKIYASEMNNYKRGVYTSSKNGEL